MPQHSPNPNTIADKESMLDSPERNFAHRQREIVQKMLTKDKLLTET